MVQKEVNGGGGCEAVTKMVLSARALPDVLVAQKALRAWIEAHPEDEGMRDGFEQLSLMQDIAEEQAQTDVQSTPPDVQSTPQAVLAAR